MARLLSPLNIFVDTDGSPLASGTVYTYLEGTTTDAITYTQKTGGSGSSGSIVLGIDGMTAAKQMWLTSGVGYKFVIKDSLGSLVATVDNIFGVPDMGQLDQDLDLNGYSIKSYGNDDITITPSGAGVVSLDGLSWPSADGTANQIIETDGAGNLSFASVTGDLLADLTPQLAADLDCNSYSIQFDTGTGFEDNSGNELVLFTVTGSAVNYLEIANTITGVDPTITAAGGDTNIGIDLVGKGSGAVSISGLSYPTADGTALQVIETDGSAALSFGDGPIATQAEMETATSTTTIASPGRLQNHPGVCKGWAKVDMAGTIDASYNVDSITDNGTGDFTVNWLTDFSSADYAVTVGIETTAAVYPTVAAQAAGTTQIVIRDISGTATETNVTSFYIAAFGDQ